MLTTVISQNMSTQRDTWVIAFLRWYFTAQCLINNVPLEREIRWKENGILELRVPPIKHFFKRLAKHIANHLKPLEFAYIFVMYLTSTDYTLNTESEMSITALRTRYVLLWALCFCLIDATLYTDNRQSNNRKPHWLCAAPTNARRRPTDCDSRLNLDRAHSKLSAVPCAL